MRSSLHTALLIAALYGAAGHAQDHDYLSASTLDDLASPDARAGRLFESDNYWSVVAHREAGPGFSESHRDWTDIYFVTSGTATLVVGGTIPEPTEETPGEVRGTSIDGGARRTLAEGDVVHIPPGTAHHVIVAPNQTITYLLLKVRATGE